MGPSCQHLQTCVLSLFKAVGVERDRPRDDVEKAEGQRLALHPFGGAPKSLGED